MRGAFRSLRYYNYRVWAAGALVSNVGTWMQRTAQDWLVLAELTHKNATALGIVMALQFRDAELRAFRLRALFLAIAVGATPIGAPFVGWVADTFGPRWALGVGAASGFGAALVAVHYFVKRRELCATAHKTPASM